MQVRFVKYDEEFLELSWGWLNDEEIKILTCTPRFSKIDQQNWYDQLSTRNDYLIWGVEAEGVKIGVVGLKNLNETQGEYWGYIGDKSFWRKGVGVQMIRYIETQCQFRQLSQIMLYVHESNHAAIGLYEHMGFKKINVINELIEMKKEI